jgi:hypothetical protein
MKTRTNILREIIKDRKQILPGVVGGIMWLILHVFDRYGLSLTTLEQAAVAGFIGTLLAAILNGWALNVVTDGVKEMQTDMKERHPWVQVDGLPGEQSQNATKLIVQEAKDANK